MITFDLFYNNKAVELVKWYYNENNRIKAIKIFKAACNMIRAMMSDYIPPKKYKGAEYIMFNKRKDVIVMDKHLTRLESPPEDARPKYNKGDKNMKLFFTSDNHFFILI